MGARKAAWNIWDRPDGRLARHTPDNFRQLQEAHRLHQHNRPQSSAQRKPQPPDDTGRPQEEGLRQSPGMKGLVPLPSPYTTPQSHPPQTPEDYIALHPHRHTYMFVVGVKDESVRYERREKGCVFFFSKEFFPFFCVILFASFFFLGPLWSFGPLRQGSRCTGWKRRMARRTA